MNERIRELHSQCKVCDKDTVLYFDYEKFAQLMAAECVSVVENLSPYYPLRYKNNLLIELHHRDQIEEVFREACVKEIKQHFGIKE